MRILLFACTLTLAVAGVVQDGRTAVQMASDHETVAYLNLCLAVLLLQPWCQDSHQRLPAVQRAAVRAVLLQGLHGRELRWQQQGGEGAGGVSQVAVPAMVWCDVLELTGRGWLAPGASE